jgi:glycosyltransferase involved in cell wall biosynthesis
MAFVLQRHSKKSKGILIIKHLEYPFYNAMLVRNIRELQRKYFIGLYLGFYTSKDYDFKNIDFYIAEDNVLYIRNSRLPRLNLNGYNFQPKSFFSRSSNKYFDFIFIGDPSRRKRLKLFLESIDKALDNRTFSTLIINRTNSKNIYSKLLNLEVRNTFRNINQTKRNNITYLEVDKSKDLIIPRTSIPFFIESAKCLVIPSLEEGAARVVAEALSKGLNVLSYKHMLGATNNHLNNEYDLLFDSKEDLVEKMSSFVENYENFYSKKNINYYKIFSEEESKQKLKSFLITTLKGFQLDKDNFEKLVLTNSLQSHNTFLPRSLPSNKKTDECQSLDSMYKLVCFATNKSARYYLIASYKVLTSLLETRNNLTYLFLKLSAKF